MGYFNFETDTYSPFQNIFEMIKKELKILHVKFKAHSTIKLFNVAEC